MKFNWHELDHDGFLSWMVVNLVTAQRINKQTESDFERISEATDGFKNVDMKITINEIDVPVDYFVKQVKNNMEYYARQVADEISGDALSDLQDKITDIGDLLNEATEAIRYKVDNFFKQ